MIKWTDRISKKLFFKHIFGAFHVILIVMFIDSAYRWNTTSSEILQYQNERNFYLCGFSFFLAIVFKKLCTIIETTYTTQQINEYAKKQHGNSMSFVTDVIKQHTEEKEKNKSLSKELSELKTELEAQKEQIKNALSIKESYLKLKKRFEKLKQTPKSESLKSTD